MDVAIGQPLLRDHIEALMRDEIEPTLPALPGLSAARLPGPAASPAFANPALAHRTHQDRHGWLAEAAAAPAGHACASRLAAEQPFDRLALGVAAWLHYLRGVDEAGLDPTQSTTRWRTPLAELRHQALAAGPTLQGGADALVSFTPVFGDLAGQQNPRAPPVAGFTCSSADAPRAWPPRCSPFAASVNRLTR